MDLLTVVLMPNACNGQPEVVPMDCVAIKLPLAALGRPAPFFMLRCACGAAGIRGV